MENRHEDLLSACCEIDFGTVNLSDGEKTFYRELNMEIFSLCKSLPESIQTDALLFFMQYTRMSFGQDMSFYRHYYIPSWSIIYWLVQAGQRERELANSDIRNARTAHAMAMSLHSIDDHLNDGEMEATHLALLIRSQSWMIMNQAFKFLADEVDEGEKIIQGFINDYYTGIRSEDRHKSLDSYCNLFRKQMATWLIVPVLLAKKVTIDEKRPRDIQTAYESFGISWRLLDDIRDIETDMREGSRSSIYFCLPEKIRDYWDRKPRIEMDMENGYAGKILDCVLENGIIKKIKERICTELESAVSIAEGCTMTGLADEYRCLLRPLRNG